MPITLSNDYWGEYLKMLHTIAATPKSKPIKVSPFWPQYGWEYPRPEALMVIGRATNGWEPQYALDSPLDTVKCTETVESIRAGIANATECPMKFVAKRPEKKGDYNPHRAAFWRIAKAIHDMLYSPAEWTDDWPSRLCWTNLYKISNVEKGNPPVWLEKAQRDACTRLLCLEIAQAEPRIVLAMTGRDWFAPFVQELRLEMTESTSFRLVEQTATKDGVLWIVGKHPQGKPDARYTEEIREALRDNNFQRGASLEAA